VVDARGEAGGAEAVVDVDHRHAARARVEPSEQRGDSAVAGALPDAGRYGHHRDLDQAADRAWQRAFHSVAAVSLGEGVLPQTAAGELLMTRVRDDVCVARRRSSAYSPKSPAPGVLSQVVRRSLSTYQRREA